MRKIRSLVTGHRGYIGGNLFTQLESLGHDVKGIDLKEGKNIVCDLDQYEDFKPDYIFHLAAIPRVAYSVEFPEEVLVYGLDTVSLRYFNVYSEDQEADGPYATAIANFMHYIRQGKTPFITGDGTQRRDMVHVSDVVSANVFCMDSNRPGEVQITKGNTLALKKIGWCAKMDISTGIRSCFQKLAAEIRE